MEGVPPQKPMLQKPLRCWTASPALVGCSIAVALFTVAIDRASPCRAAEAEAVDKFRDSVEPLLETYCYACHAYGEKNGGVAFDGFKSTGDLVANRDLWRRVLKNVRAGIMPPAGEERPSAEEQNELANWIKHKAFAIDPANPDPGRVTVRRLNREEYRNTIRDLMGIDFKAFEEFPPDDTGYGFDNIGDVLSVSPLLLEKYLQAAEAIVNEAVPTASKVVREQKLAARDFRDANGQSFDQMTFYKEASVNAKFDASHAGDYGLDVVLAVRGAFDTDPGRATSRSSSTVRIAGNKIWRGMTTKSIRSTSTKSWSRASIDFPSSSSRSRHRKRRGLRSICGSTRSELKDPPPKSTGCVPRILSCFSRRMRHTTPTSAAPMRERCLGDSLNASFSPTGGRPNDRSTGYPRRRSVWPGR